MSMTQAAIDILRAGHLAFFAAGMGTALYFDFQKLKTFSHPLNHDDIERLEKLHVWISSAFLSLWLTGLMLIYVRTGFDIATFSPKLWLKLGVMTFMLLVSSLIGAIVIPSLKAHMGQPLITMSRGRMMLLTQIGVFSMFGWSSGLLLGSSVVLKTATWDVLLPITLFWCGLLSLGGQTLALMIRRGYVFRAI